MSERGEWFLKRKQVVTATDVAAICGLSPYRSAFDVWMDKTREDIPPDAANDAMSWGNRLEPVIAAAYTEQYGIKVVGVQNTAELREMLDVIMLRRTEDEGLPPLRFEEFWLPFDPALPMEVLEAGVAARDWQDEIPADAAHATARRMLGALKAVPVGELIAQELEDGAYQKIVVGAYHHGVIDGLWTLLKPYGAVVVSGRTRPEHRRSRIAQFQSDPSARVFIGQLTACGTSIDLFAATEVALVEQSWAPDDNFQFCKRVHRTGQTSSVRVRSFYADCDLDEGVARVLARKTRLNGEVLY